MNAKPKRRWLRFSVRTLLIAVTIFCVWLGWQVSIVRDRRKALDFVTQSGGRWHSYLDEKTPPPPGFYKATVSTFRLWLGDKPVVWVMITPVDHARLQWLGNALPEANIRVWRDPAFNEGPAGLWDNELQRVVWPSEASSHPDLQ